MLGYLLFMGSSPPEGANPSWSVQRSHADIVQGDGWLITGPFSELMSWPPAGLAIVQGGGEPDFYQLQTCVPGPEYSALVEALESGTDAEVRAAAAALIAARGAIFEQ